MAKILVVEDEDDLREIIDEELASAGHLVVNAANGKVALDHLTEESVDLIISDITMPEMNGYQFYRSVREQLPQHAHIPFIFMTALADRGDQIKGLRLGVDDYITKPIDFDLMLLRVEANLRRRQSTAETPLNVAAAQGAKETAYDVYRSDPDSAAKLNSIVKESDGRLLASRFTTISLEKVRARVGEKWEEVGEQILLNAEMIIRAHLGPKDSLCATPSQDFMVCFAELDGDQLIAKTTLMRDEIWDKLFEITNDEELSSVEAQSYEIPTDADTFDDDITFVDFDEIVNEQNEKEKESCRRKLEQIYTYEEFYAFPLIASNGSPSKIKNLSFDDKFAEKVSHLTAILNNDGKFLLGLQDTMFQRLKDKDKFGRVYSGQAMLLPVDFSLMCNSETREGLTSLCKDLEEKLGILPIIEVVRLPDRLKSHMDVLAPLPVGRKLQFLEIRRPQQCDDVSFHQRGVAYVSMSFGNAMASRSKDFAGFAKRLQDQGVKIYIKGVPEGKLFEAQQFHGTMFSMLK